MFPSPWTIWSYYLLIFLLLVDTSDLSITLLINSFIKYMCVFNVLSMDLGIGDTAVNSEQTRQKALPFWAYSHPRAVCGHLLNCQSPAATGGGVGTRINYHLTHCFLEGPCPLNSKGTPPRRQETSVEYSSTQAGDCWNSLYLFFSEWPW